MATWRDLNSPDADNFLRSVSSNFQGRTAQRIAGGVATDIARQQEEQRRQQERQVAEQQRQMEDQQRELVRQQNEQARAAETERARSVRAAEAAGAKIETDIETGKRSVATHTDGAVKYVPGPVGQPVEKPIVDPEVGPPERIGTSVKLVQPYRDDRGGMLERPVPAETDPKTAEIYSKVEDPVTGLQTRRVLGVDPVQQARIQQTAQLDQERQKLDLRSNAIKQERMRFNPSWEPVKREFDEAGQALNNFKPAFRRNTESGTWEKIDPKTDSPVPYDPRELAVWQREKDSLNARYDRAKRDHDRMFPEAERLNAAERKAREESLLLAERRIRLESGLPDDDGGTAAILAKSSGQLEELPTDRAVAEVTGGQSLTASPDKAAPPSEASTAPAPLLKPESDSEALKSAFGALRGVEGLQVEQRNGWTALNRDGDHIASIQDGGGSPIVVLERGAGDANDINRTIALGQTKGVPLYLRDSPERKNVTDEATQVAAVWQALEDPALRDESGRGTSALQARLTELGATPEQIKTRVDSGTLSIQHGEALMKDVWGQTLSSPDPEDPEAFNRWLMERSKAERQRGVRETVMDRMSKAKAGTGFSLADQNQVRQDFVSDWYAQNRGKPGVTREKAQRLMGFDASDSASTTERIASMATAARRMVVNDALGSMFGLFGGGIKDLGAAEVSLFGNKEAQAEFSRSMRLRNRDFANFLKGSERNIKAWTTGDGIRATNDFESAVDGLRRTIDEEQDKPQPDQAKIAAAELQARQAALRLHELAPDEKWRMTEEGLDPDKDPALGGALARYVATADPREFELYKERLKMSHGRRQASAEIEKATRGKDRFGQAFYGAMHAGWQELGTELLADASIVVTAGGSKAVQAGLRGAGAIGKAERIARVGERIGQALDRVAEIGIKAESLASPLSRVDRARNAVVRTVKTGVQAAAGEAGEEVITELGADTPDFAQAALSGALGGVALTPVFYPMQRAAERRFDANAIRQREADDRVFANRFNAGNAGVPGFQPITAETASAARLLVDPAQFENSIIRLQEAEAELGAFPSSQNPEAAAPKRLENLRAEISRVENALANARPDRAAAIEGQLAALVEQEALLAPDAQPETDGGTRFAQALRNRDEAIGDLARQTESVVAAASEIEQQTDPRQRAFLAGIAKVATGNTAVLTQNERQALTGAVTAGGQSYFADVGGREVLTDAARAEISTNFPAVGALIQTTESRAILDASLESPQPTPITNESESAPQNPPLDVPVPDVPAPESAATPARDERARPSVDGPSGTNQPPDQSSDGKGLEGLSDSNGTGGAGRTEVGGTAGEVSRSGPDETGEANGPQQDRGDAQQPQAEAEATPEATLTDDGTDAASAVIARSIQRVGRKYPNVRRSIRVIDSPEIMSAFYATPEGVFVNRSYLEGDLNAFEGRDRDARADAALDEEIVHFAGFQHMIRMADSAFARMTAEERSLFVTGWFEALPIGRKDDYGSPDVAEHFKTAFIEEYEARLWREFSPEQQKKFAETYQGNFNALPDWAKGGEAIRIVTQIAVRGNPTEALNLVSKGKAPLFKGLLREAIQFLKNLVGAGEVSPMIQRAIDGFTAMLKSFSESNHPESPDSSPSLSKAETPESTGKQSLQDGESLPDRVNAAARKTDTDLTEAQKEAGNYRKGQFPFKGLTIAIENPRGSIRSGTDSKGNQWSVELAHHYGYFRRTEGRDGDQVDVFIGPDPESERVFIVNQVNPQSGRFDEHKVMIGFKSRKEAIAGYLGNYSPGWKGLGDMVEADVDGLKKWLTEGDLTRRASSAMFDAAEEIGRIAPVRQKVTADKVETFKLSPVISGIVRAGGMQSWSAASRGRSSEWIDRNRPTWDDKVILPPSFNAVIYSATSANAPDKIAQTLASQGIGDGTVTQLWREIERAANGAMDRSGTRDSRMDPNRDWSDEEIEQYLNASGLSSADPGDGSVRRAPVTIPDALVVHPLAAATAHKGYRAAKSGDPRAALDLARDLVTEDMVSRVRAMLGGQRATIVPVLAIEESGMNMIPAMTAKMLGSRLGLDVTPNIVQIRKASRTGKSALDRIFASSGFSGPVIAGENYLLLDDTLTQGGTFAALADHVQAGGGKVAGAVALTGKQYSAKLSPSDESIRAVRENFGDVEDAFRRATGYGFDHLTESEARSLLSFKPSEAVRGRILAEADGPGDALGGQGTGEGPRLSSADPGSPNVGRNKPRQIVTFAKPITGPSGASISSYEWKYTLVDDVDKRGEDITRRVSDWEQSATNTDTGREVVHQFYVTDQDGRNQVVSLESALRILGYTNAKQGAPIKSLASVLKTRARNQMELDQMEARLAIFEAERDRLKPIVAALPLPPVRLDADRGPMGARYTMGDEWQVAKSEQEAVKLMEPSWREREMARRMGSAWIAYDYLHRDKIADLKSRIKKADKKIAEAAAAASVEPTITPDSPGSQPTLFASDPASPSPSIPQQVIDNALRPMSPMHRAVFEESLKDSSVLNISRKFNISEKAVANITQQVYTRIRAVSEAARGEIKADRKDGKLVPGRPDLALSTNETVGRAQQIREQDGGPGVVTFDEVFSRARNVVEKDFKGTLDGLIEKRSQGISYTLDEIAQAKTILRETVLRGEDNTPEMRMKMALLATEYIDQGTDDARRLAFRRDPDLTPAQRHAEYLAEMLYTPEKATRDALKGASKSDREAMITRWSKQVDTIKQALKNQGLDIDATLDAFRERERQRREFEAERPRATAVIEDQVKALSPAHRAVMRALMGGSKLDVAADAGNVSYDEAKQVLVDFRTSTVDAMRKATRKFIDAAMALSAADPSALEVSILAEFGIPSLEDVDVRDPAFEKRQKDKAKARRKEAEQRRKEREKASNQPTDEQKAKWDQLAEEFFARPMSTWRSLWQTEMKKLDPITAQKNFDFKEADIIQPWKDLWQTEMPGVAWSEPKFKEWADADPARKQMVMDLFKAKINELTGTWSETRPFLGQGELWRAPVNETTGTFDLSDPVAMKAVAAAFAYHRPAGLIDRIMEFWKASILSGPQTAIVNAGSNAVHSLYNILPRRLVEATINGMLGKVGLGSPEAADLGEFQVMAKHLNQALKDAGRSMLQSWRLEDGELFERYAMAQPYQQGFNGAKWNDKESRDPALRGWLGKVMHAISFRHLTAADQFFQAFNGRIEAAAQSHRIAKAEGLKGKEYEARIDELMKPGSLAWIRSIDVAKESTFQQPIDSSRKGLINVVDSLVEVARSLRNKPGIGPVAGFFLPFLNTPGNVFKRGIEISPLGLGIAIFDGIHALYRRYGTDAPSKVTAIKDASEYYNRARFVRDLTNQTIGMGIFFAVQAMIEDDEDENGLPGITGTAPFTTTKQGEREVFNRTMPPMTIRIGSTFIPYGRIEPFALPVASFVDSVYAVKRNGGFNGAAFGNIISSFGNKIGDMPMMEGVRQIQSLWSAATSGDGSLTERELRKIGTSIATGFVPNLVRQPLREMAPFRAETSPRVNDNALESIARPIGYSIVPQAAPPQLDVWGKPVPANEGSKFMGNAFADAFFRALDPLNVSFNRQPDPIDVWILKNNLEAANREDRISITPLRDYLEITVPGEKKRRKVQLSPEELLEAQQRIGKSAREILGNDWGPKTPRTDDRRDRIRKVFEDLKRMETQRLKAEKMTLVIPPKAASP